MLHHWHAAASSADSVSHLLPYVPYGVLQHGRMRAHFACDALVGLNWDARRAGGRELSLVWGARSVVAALAASRRRRRPSRLHHQVQL
jgi:hypothetical protein